MRTITTKQACIAAALLAMPVSASAQNQVADQANAVAEQARELEQETNDLTNVVAEERQLTDDATTGTTRDEDDDDDFPWGLLGLLGLGGLLGLKRRDDRRDVHVDTRRDTDRNSQP